MTCDLIDGGGGRMKRSAGRIGVGKTQTSIGIYFSHIQQIKFNSFRGRYTVVRHVTSV